MPAPKFTTKAGATVTRIKASIFLHPELHRRLNAEAKRAGVSLSDLVSHEAARLVKWEPAGQTS